MAEESVMLYLTAKRAKAEISLIKLPISLMSALTALAGYSMRLPVLSEGAVITAAGVFLLAAGSSVLNNLQDRSSDQFMVRTAGRPLPSGAVSPLNAFIQSVLFTAAGTAILTVYTGTLLPAAAGLFAVLLYNGIYTAFKRYRFISLFSGVLCGMLSPLIGWFSAGGSVPSLQIVYFMVLLGVWQIPHTWLIVLINRKDYKTAGVSTVIDIFSDEILKGMLLLWILFFAILTLFAEIFFYNINVLMTVLLIANAASLAAVFFTRLILKKEGETYDSLFHHLNFSMLGVTLLTISYPLSAQGAF